SNGGFNLISYKWLTDFSPVFVVLAQFIFYLSNLKFHPSSETFWIS
ncbi:25507_t:CDS:1, partial [Racocetra persica]